MDLLGLIGLIVIFIAVLPVWPYSTRWSYLPAIVMGVLLVALIAGLFYQLD